MTQQFLEDPEGTFSKKEGRYGVYYELCATPHNINFLCDTDVDYTRNRIRILSSVVDIAPSLSHEHQRYEAFFEDHTLPNRMEKRLHGSLENDALYRVLTPLFNMVTELLHGESWRNVIIKRH